MKRRMKWGAASIGCSFLLSLDPWLVPYFAFPLYLLGAVLALTSPGRAMAKVSLLVAPLVLWYPSMRVFLWVWSGADKDEIVLIPDGFRGEAWIIFDEPCGDTIREEQGAWVHSLDARGMRVTRAVPQTGMNSIRYFQVDSAGARKQIHPFSEDSAGWKGVSVWGGGGGTAEAEGAEGGPFRYTKFVVADSAEYRHGMAESTGVQLKNGYRGVGYASAIRAVNECRRKNKMSGSRDGN